MEQEINLKSIIYGVIKQWKFILLTGIILAAILGGMEFHEQYSASANPALAEKEYQEKLGEYNVQLLEYNALESTLLKDTEYLQDSLYINFDAYDLQIARIDVYVDSLYEILTDKSVQSTDNINKIMHAYSNKINYGELYGDIAATLGADIQSKYIKEFVVSEVDVTNANIGFTVTMDDVADVEMVLATISLYISEVYDEVKQEVADHEISVLQSTIVSEISQELEAKQIELAIKAETKERDLVNLKSTLSEPVSATFTLRGALVDTLIKCVIGGILGCILYAGIVFVVLLLSNNLMDESFIEEQFKLKILGVKPTKKLKNNFVDNIIDSIYDSTLFKNEEEFYDYLVENIKLNDGAVIHVTGTLKDSEIQEVYEKISKRVDGIKTCGGYILQDKKSLLTLSKSENVILVEKRFKTNLNKMQREIATINEMDKNIVGVVLL